MHSVSKRLFIVNLLATFFYLGCLIQWLWSVLHYMPGIISFVDMLQTPREGTTLPALEPTMMSGPPSLLVIIIGVIVTVAILGVSVYVLIKLPTTIAKSGQKLTKSVSSHIVPVVTHHATLTPKKRQRLTARVIVDLKLALCITPIILGVCTYFFTTDLPYEIILLVTAILGIGSLVLLSMQMLAVKWLRAPIDAIW